MDEEFYYSGENEVCHVTEARVTVLSHWSQKTLQLPSGLLELLGPPGQRVTRDRLDAVLAPLAPPERDALAHALTGEGFLLRPEQLDARVAEMGGPPAEKVQITTCSVLTCDRPTVLLRCLSSYARNAARHGRRLRLLVLDDSANVETAEASRAAARSTDGLGGAVVEYAGPPQKERFAGALSARDAAPPEVIRFALQHEDKAGWRFGANRNAGLLATAGEAMLCVDDDTVCRIAADGTALARLAVASPYATLGLSFFDSMDELRSEVRFEERDLVGLHERLLGRPLAVVLSAGVADAVPREAGEDEATAALDARVLGSLRRRRGRVLATSLGVAGDPAAASRRWYFLLRGATRARLLDSVESYHAACTKGVVLRRTDAVTLTGGDLWMSYCAGLDNRGILPPYFPYRGNEDGLFMGTALALDRTACVGHLPAAVLHEPPAPRAYRTDDLSAGFAFLGAAEVLYELVTNSAPTIDSLPSAERLRRLGRTLLDLAGEPRGFAQSVREVSWRIRVGRLQHLQRLTTFAEGPPTWRVDLDSQIAALQASLLDRDFPGPIVDRPSPGRPGRGPQDADELRHEALCFGRLCCHWPDLVEAAGDLARDGTLLAVAP
jgi:hypothetical protein